MTDTRPPIDPGSLAEQMGDLPKAGDRLRLVGLDHIARMQQARVGAANRWLALAQARRPDDGEAISRLESRVTAETQAQRSLDLAVQAGEIEVPARTSGTAVIHGRVIDQTGAPASGVTVAAIDVSGRVERYSCTDGKGYFRLDLPVTPDRVDVVTLQVSGPDQTVLYRGSEAIELADQGVTYRVIQLGDTSRPPCPRPPERATMPNLLGQPETAAVATLGRLGLKLGQRLTQRDPERAGLVLSQEPQAGTPIDSQTSVTLVIGAAEPGDTVAVPDVVGQPRDEAAAKLKEAGLAVGAISTRPGDQPGIVLSQEPQAGTGVAQGTAIALVIAVEKPDERITVPDLVGKTLDDASMLLQQAGLARGNIGLRDDPHVGLVLEHNPKAGTPVAKASPVDLVVGRQVEVERTKVPDLKGNTLSEASTALERARLQFGEVSGPRNGRVTDQKPAAGSAVAAGSTVAIALALARGTTAPRDFGAGFAKAIAAEKDFADLGIEVDALGAMLTKAKVDTVEAAQSLADLAHAELQKVLGLRNRKQAGALKRMLRGGIERL